MKLKTCVEPSGKFIFGIHRPEYKVTNFRENDFIASLGRDTEGNVVLNEKNFPPSDLEVSRADWIYEIPNPFPFRGTTYICRSWADSKADNPGRISLHPPKPVSMTDTLGSMPGKILSSSMEFEEAFRALPEPLLITLASTSTDPRDLTLLAKISCDFTYDAHGEEPTGLRYQDQEKYGYLQPVVHNEDLFETVVNNVHLPDTYKEIMVLRPGVQGGSEIVGEFGKKDGKTHIFEYLRRNSYIAWGHYAANMANDAMRYRIEDLSKDDMEGLRHLYYQRTYSRLAELFKIPLPALRKTLSRDELESIRLSVVDALQHKKVEKDPEFNATLWGWNFGFDFAASGYRLHASHQQIHQQFSLLPKKMEGWHNGIESANFLIQSYACGDLISDFCRDYANQTGRDFFEAYIQAIRGNRRMDDRQNENHSLIVYEDDNVIVFVPKAQTSQWELQMMTIRPVGNILEADTSTRKSLDAAIFIAQQALAALGARMVTSIEFSKRLDDWENCGQRLLYSFLPKLPYSMGAFSEAQLRWINGHFPEDFAAACRAKVKRIISTAPSLQNV